MQERVRLTDAEINRDLLRSTMENPLWYWLLVGALGLIVVVAFGAAGYMFNKGLGVTGLNRPVMWGFFITNFVFWIGISHAGVMLSAILRLAQAEWRRPATRAAEVLTVFSLMTAMLMPLIHAGRPWRVAYWVFPFDWARGVYPNVPLRAGVGPRRRVHLPDQQHPVRVHSPGAGHSRGPGQDHRLAARAVHHSGPWLEGQREAVEASS